MRDEVLGQFEQAVEVAVGDFGLDHPELSEVTPSLGFFGAEGGAEAVNLAQCKCGGLDIKLAGLGEVGGVSEVVHGEQRGRALAGCRSENRRIGADEAVGVKVLGCRAHDFGPYAKNGRLPGRANPQMAVLHEEVDTVFFERDGVGVGLRNTLDDLHIFDVEFESAGRALVGADFARDNDRRLLSEAFERFEDGRGNALHVGYALNRTGAVAKDGKEQFAALAQVVKPSAQGDRLAFVLAQGGDGGYGSGDFRGCVCGCG